LVKQPGRDLANYRAALRYIEEACALVPEDGSYLNTLGVTYYRLGDYQKALETLIRSNKIHAVRSGGSEPADLAFLAMTHHRLGNNRAAQGFLKRLKDASPREGTEALALLREAEAILQPAKETPKKSSAQ